MLVQGMCLDVMCLEKQQKPVQAGAQDPLSDLESGHAFPISPQDFCSPCVFVYCCHNTASYFLPTIYAAYSGV